LLNAAISGVRAVQGTGPRIPVALSIDKGDLNGQPQFFYSNIQNPSLGNVTDFDIEGVDFYSSGNSGLSTMTSNLTSLANTNFSAFSAVGNTKPLKRIMVLETNWPKSTNNSYTGTWAKTPAGQEAEMVAVRDMLLNLPHGDGAGALYWY